MLASPKSLRAAYKKKKKRGKLDDKNRINIDIEKYVKNTNIPSHCFKTEVFLLKTYPDKSSQTVFRRCPGSGYGPNREQVLERSSDY